VLPPLSCAARIVHLALQLRHTFLGE